MKKLLFSAFAAALACGCASVNRNDGGDACVAPCIAKDIVHEKFSVGKDPVTAREELKCLFGFFCWGGTATHFADAVPCDSKVPLLPDYTAVAKNGAYANACDAANCDRIVGTKYTVTVDNYLLYKKITAEVSGYPVTLTGVELIENRVPCPCK